MGPENLAILRKRAGLQLVQIKDIVESDNQALDEAGVKKRLGDESFPSIDPTTKLNGPRLKKAADFKSFADLAGSCQVFGPGAEADVQVIYPHDNTLNYRDRLIVVPAELNGVPSIPGLPMFLSENSFLAQLLEGLPSRSAMQGVDPNGLEIVAVLYEVK